MNALVLEETNFSAALSIVRALGRLGHRADVAAPWETPATRSRWCRRPMLSPSPWKTADYIQFLTGLLHARDYDIVFISDDRVMEVISQARTRLPAHPGLMLPPPEAVALAGSKLEAQRLAAGLGVPTPLTAGPRSLAELDAAARGMGFPLVVKGDRGGGGTHVRYPENPEQLRRAYHEVARLSHVGRPMVQEFIPGDSYLTQVVYDRGKLVAICSHRKLRQFPLAGGVLAKAVTVNEPQLDAHVERLFTALRWHGPAKADFKRDERDGRFKLMELDPRLPAGIELALAAGADLVEVCCEMVAQRGIEPRLDYRKGVAVRYVCRDLLCLAAQPGVALRVLLDALDPRLRSDFDWSDRPGSKAMLRRAIWMFDDNLRKGALAADPSNGTGKRSLAQRCGRNAQLALLRAAGAGLSLTRRIRRGARPADAAPALSPRRSAG